MANGQATSPVGSSCGQSRTSRGPTASETDPGSSSDLWSTWNAPTGEANSHSRSASWRSSRSEPVHYQTKPWSGPTWCEAGLSGCNTRSRSTAARCCSTQTWRSCSVSSPTRSSSSGSCSTWVHSASAKTHWKSSSYGSHSTHGSGSSIPASTASLWSAYGGPTKPVETSWTTSSSSTQTNGSASTSPKTTWGHSSPAGSYPETCPEVCPTRSSRQWTGDCLQCGACVYGKWKRGP